MSASEPINDLYSRRLLAYAADIPHLGHLEKPNAAGDAVSRLCGSEVHVEICVGDGVITEFAQDVKACALGQTSASVVGHHVVGASRGEIDQARIDLAALLKDGTSMPAGRFSELEVLAGVKGYPARHASVLLVLDALLNAFGHLDDPAD